MSEIYDAAVEVRDALALLVDEVRELRDTQKELLSALRAIARAQHYIGRVLTQPESMHEPPTYREGEKPSL